MLNWDERQDYLPWSISLGAACAVTNLLGWCWCLSHHSPYRQSSLVPAHPPQLRLTCHSLGTLGEEENKGLEFGRSD